MGRDDAKLIVIIPRKQPLEMGESVRARSGTVDQNLIQANAQHKYEVRHDDIPISCPMPGMYLWNSHPKVYLPIQEAGEAICPYCGAKYILVDNQD